MIEWSVTITSAFDLSGFIPRHMQVAHTHQLAPHVSFEHRMVFPYNSGQQKKLSYFSIPFTISTRVSLGCKGRISNVVKPLIVSEPKSGGFLPSLSTAIFWEYSTRLRGECSFLMKGIAFIPREGKWISMWPPLVLMPETK